MITILNDYNWGHEGLGYINWGHEGHIQLGHEGLGHINWGHEGGAYNMGA